MLALEVKNVDGETNVLEERISCNRLFERTVVVEENMVRDERHAMVGALDKFLYQKDRA